ncbi:MAG: phage terminase large subunit family protein, partial [Fimbriimonadaceae bacterium]|nr:phage terminase large subunit family protein [Alphaproteobacteria bacterium]
VIDSGDGVTVDNVYAFTKPRFYKSVYAGKGMAGFGRPQFHINRRSKAKDGNRVAIIGTEAIKSMIFGSLNKAGAWHFSDSLDSEWFDQLLSEQLKTQKRKGVEVKTFVPISGKRQEALDCTVYAIAARYSFPRLNWEKLRDDIENQTTKKKKSIADIASAFNR